MDARGRSCSLAPPVEVNQLVNVVLARGRIRPARNGGHDGVENLVESRFPDRSLRGLKSLKPASTLLQVNPKIGIHRVHS